MENTIKRTGRELVYEGSILKVYRDDMEFADGHTSKWDYIHLDGAAAVLPVADDGRILLVRQYRNALDRYTWEIPAGKLDRPDEPGIVCAARELEEETGYRSGCLELLLTIRTLVAFCNEKVEIYAAKDLILSQQHLDEEEEIEIRFFTPEELKSMIFRQEIEDNKTISAVMAYLVKYGS